MRKHDYVDYIREGETLDLIVRDFSGAKIEKWTVNIKDKKRLKQIFKTIEKRYGVELFFKKVDEDLDWLG